MPENEPIRRFVPLPTQFLQEEEPSDTDEDDEQNEEYDQPLAHFQHPTARLTSAHDHRTQSFSSGRGISSDTFYGISQRNLSYGQNHGVEDDMSAQTLRSFMGRHIPKNDDCSQNSYEYQEVFDDPHQLIPSYHEYSITNSPTHSYSPTSGDSAGMPEYFISRGASTAMRSGGLGYASRTTEQGDTVFCESQQRLQEPKVISNESNRYTVVGHTVEGQPIYALQSVRTQDRPRLHQGSLYRVMENSAQPRYVFLRQQAGPARRLQRDVGDHNSSNENYRAVAREIVAKALEDKRQKQFSQESQPSSSGVSVIASKTRRRLVMPDDEESEKISGSTAAAQVAAIQRFSTPLGWKQMGSWLKTAEANEDWSRLKLLLSQCSQANLTLELLQSNDTPKFVRKLSKTCPDQDIRKVSGDLVVRWKRLISAPSHQVSDELKKVGSAKRKTPHPVSGGASKAKVKKDSLDSAKTVERESKLDGNKQKDACGNKMESNKKSPNTENSEKSDAAKAEKLMKTSSTKSKVEKTEKLSESTKSTSNKLNEFNMFEKLGEEGKEKKRRPKTAKTYTSKFRSTGLEGNDELGTGKTGDSMVVASKKKGGLPGKTLLDAKKRSADLASMPKVAPVNASPPVLSAPFVDKKSTSSTPARVMMSNTFMDALMDPGHKKALPKQVKKRSTLNLKSSTSVMPSVMEGLYSDTSKSLNRDKQDEGPSDEKKELVVEEPDITPIGNRKIRFADENGQELVDVRYFEVEEGERLNVSKLSSEDMKHLEMQRERTFLKEQRNLHITEFGFNSGRSEGITHIPWKLIPLTDAVFFERRGSQSEAKKIEEERQKTIMMPFYDPSLPAELADAEPELLSGAILPPTEIPLESETDEEDLNQGIAQAFADASIATGALADHSQGDGKEIDVQKLMTELKKKGLVGSSSDLANILNKVSTTTAAIATTTVASVPSVSQVTVATTPTYAQLTLPAHSGVAGIPNMSLPPPRFAHGLPMPPVLPTGQYILPVQQQQPLLNGPVPAGVTPTVGVDLTTQSGPSTSEATSYGTYGRPGIKQCTFYQSGTCSYGARCRFAHGDEPTAGTQGYGYSDERGRSFRRGGQSFRGGPRRGGADGVYRRERGGPSFARRGFYDRGRERDRDREREYDYDRRIYDRYGRRRRRSLSRSKSRSRSRSRSLSPFERRPYSPDRRRRGSPHAMNECDQGEHFERRSRGDDRERNDQHVVGVENQLIDAKPRLQNHPTTEGQCSVGGIGCLTGVESVASTDQQKSPPEDPIPSMKPESVQAGSTDSPASPT